MNQVSSIRLLPVVVALALAACVPAPKKAYAPQEAETLSEIDEVMRVNAATMDPLFGQEDATAFDAATWAQVEKAAPMIQSTGKALQKPTIASPYPEGFVAYGEKLRAAAERLGAAGTAKDVAAATKEIRTIHETCRACHSEFR